MEVHAAGSHPAEVQREPGPDHVSRPLNVVVDDEIEGHRDLEVLRGELTPRESLLEVRAVELVVVLGGVEQREPAVRDLGGLSDVLRTFGAEEDRDPLAQWMHSRLQWLAQAGDAVTTRGRERIVWPVRGDRGPPGDRVAHNPHVFPRPRQRLGERLPVPPLDDLWP